MANILLKKLYFPAGVLSRSACPLSRAGGSGSEVRVSPLHCHAALQNSNRTSVVRCSRQKYVRMFPVVLVHPDGSTVNIRYREPRCILQLPVNLSTLPEEERRARLKKREVKKPQTEDKYYEDDFQADTYSHLWKKKK